jgi:hypothetical protein
MLSKSKIAVAGLVVASVGLLATDSAFARNRKLLALHAPPNHFPTIVQRMGNVAVDPTVTGTWTPFDGLPGHAAAFPGTSPDTALLLTDGSVVMHDVCTPNWYRLIPDQLGNYINGSWDPAPLGDIHGMQGDANTPNDGYAPLFYASVVLPDGRLIVQGGEYEKSQDPTCSSGIDSNKGSLLWPAVRTRV